MINKIKDQKEKLDIKFSLYFIAYSSIYIAILRINYIDYLYIYFIYLES